MKKQKTKKEFAEDWPTGPCSDKWKECVCSCGWEYNEKEVIHAACSGDCDVCNYCGIEKCPKCGKHLHCGGCI